MVTRVDEDKSGGEMCIEDRARRDVLRHRGCHVFIHFCMAYLESSARSSAKVPKVGKGLG